MTEWEIGLPPEVKVAQVVAAIEQAAAAQSLTQTLKGTLARYPGCLHWHFTKAKLGGTLEITYWPSTGRLWFKVAHNRQKPWIEKSIPLVKKSILARLRLRS